MIPVQNRIFANKGPAPERLCRLAVIWEDVVVCVSAPGLHFALHTFHLVSDSARPFDFEKLCRPCVRLRGLSFHFCSHSALKGFRIRWSKMKSTLLHSLVLIIVTHSLLFG